MSLPRTTVTVVPYSAIPESDMRYYFCNKENTDINHNFFNSATCLTYHIPSRRDTVSITDYISLVIIGVILISVTTGIYKKIFDLRESRFGVDWF